MLMEMRKQVSGETSDRGEIVRLDFSDKAHKLRRPVCTKKKSLAGWISEM